MSYLEYLITDMWAFDVETTDCMSSGFYFGLCCLLLPCASKVIGRVIALCFLRYLKGLESYEIWNIYFGSSANGFKWNVGLNYEKRNPENKDYLFYQDSQSRALINSLFNVFLTEIVVS